MHLFACENPKYVYNRYLDRDVRCACGECATCLNQRAKIWISRLIQENQSHKYAFMFNLTYSEEFLPSLGFSEDFSSLVWDDRHKHLDSIPLHELTSMISEDKDMEYLSARLRDGLSLPVICIDDLQRFLKRLNKHIHDNYTQSYENFRYFLCTEYGPATFRPHAHGILFIDNDTVANHIQQIIRSCWSFGDCPTECIFSDGGFTYVAQYVNMSCHLPAFYSHPKLRQKQIFSRSPAIGSRTLLAEEVRDLYDRKPVVRTVWDSLSGKYVDLSECSAVKDRFFPKCPQYNTRSFADRVPLYRCTQILPSLNFADFRSSIDVLNWRLSRCQGSKDETKLALYIQDLKRNAKNDHSFNSSLYRLYLTGKRVNYIAHCLNSSLDYVLRHIDEYYKKVDYYNLKKFFEWQSLYSIDHPVSDLMFAYPDFVRDMQFYEKYPKLKIPLSVEYAIGSFGLDLLKDYHFEDTFDFKVMLAKSFKIYKDTHKNHDVNNYRYSEKLHRSNPSLQKILINYGKT